MDQPDATSSTRRRLSLTRSDLQTSVGLELLDVLQTIAADGKLTATEVEQLRDWLVANDGADLPGHSHLLAVVAEVLADGIVSDAEFEALHDEVLRVLPADLRPLASMRRRERKSQERADRAQARDDARELRRVEKERDRSQSRSDFMVAGTRFEGRQETCASCAVDEPVWLEREPANPYDRNAVLIRRADGGALGYVPRGIAAELAPMIDAGGRQSFRVAKLLQTARGQVIPVVVGSLFRPDAAKGYAARAELPSVPPLKRQVDPLNAPVPPAVRTAEGESEGRPSPPFGKGIWWFVLVLVVVALVLALLTGRM